MYKKDKNIKKPKILITGGGTGGHVFPAIAIANALKPHIGKENILFVGAKEKMEMEKVPKAGYNIIGLPIRGLKGKITLNNILLLFRIIISLISAIKIIRKFSPDIVVGVGGFASAPALIAAKWLNIPIVIQEQNSVPGKVNRYIGNKANAIFTAFDSANKYFPKQKVILTGNPVRKEITKSETLHNEGRKAFGLDDKKPVLLIIGGSQGASSINNAVLNALPQWIEQEIQVIWQTGIYFASKATDFVEGNNYKGVIVTPFIDSMEHAYGAADLVISRAGALALAEIAVSGLPSILAPYPFAADNHQVINAKEIEEFGAAVMVEDEKIELSLSKIISELFSNKNRLNEMSQKASELAKFDADEVIAKEILKLAGYNINSKIRPIEELQQAKCIYFLGAGGIGMSGLVRWFLKMGKEVHGYDRTKTPLTESLESEGAKIHYNDNPEMIPHNTDLVIITPAIPQSLNEYKEILRSGIPVMKRAEVLGVISKTYKTIAVAGTHGKTSTSALITHLLKNAKIPVTAFVGGVMKNYDSNFIFSYNSKYLVAEADEFDRSFLHLQPDFIIITSTDADHLDVYKTHENLKQTFLKFGMSNKDDGELHIGPGVKIKFNKPVVTYGLNEDHYDNRAFNINDNGTTVSFDLFINNAEATGLILGIPGIHNIENAVAAVAAALWAGASIDCIRRGLANYKGVKRRFDIRINSDSFIYIDDYAHHPSEITSCIDAVRKSFQGKKITAIFQPHLYSRTKDFADKFAESLDQIDRIILIEIYPAREEPIAGIDSKMLFDLIKNENKLLTTKERVIHELDKEKPELLITLGAGDIDTLVPIIEAWHQERRCNNGK